VFSLLNVAVALELLGARVCFITMKNLILTQVSNLKQYVLLIDEIDRDVFDQVIERKAVQTFNKFIFKPSLFSAYAKVIGFSGSIDGTEEKDVIKAHYADPIILSVPRLQNSEIPSI
jgi:hypothetical protein